MGQMVNEGEHNALLRLLWHLLNELLEHLKFSFKPEGKPVETTLCFIVCSFVFCRNLVRLSDYIFVDARDHFMHCTFDRRIVSVESFK